MSTKEKVLSLLQNNIENPVSGEKIASECGVSRTAIWKAVNSLRQQGYQISGTTKGGYILKALSDIFSKDSFSEYFSRNFAEYSDSNIEVFSEIDSTNTYAKRVLTEAGSLRLVDESLTEAGKKFHKSIIVAEMQTAGRGRLGRTFYSPSKTGVYLSIIYAPRGGITNPAILTAFAAVAVCRAVKKLFSAEPKIKWINDIFVNGKKICGILTEGFTNFETMRIESAIVGIGVNIKDNPDIFPEEVKKVAGSITGNSAANASRCDLAAEIAGQFLTLMEGDHSQIMKEYKESSFLIGQTLEVHPVIGDENSVYKAKAIDIDDNAGLIVELSDGSQKTLSSGEVSLKSYNFV
ncbi:MAG: biotin--[acetyl-CoA-carboxylase] ligase [Treponema sp.]|nr:biotin--[acetyl-CoA-carboxylase] ligase [Candidatus Treponema equifaecale]